MQIKETKTYTFSIDEIIEAVTSYYKIGFITNYGFNYIDISAETDTCPNYVATSLTLTFDQ